MSKIQKPKIISTNFCNYSLNFWEIKQSNKESGILYQNYPFQMK